MLNVASPKKVGFNDKKFQDYYEKTCKEFLMKKQKRLDNKRLEKE